MTTQKPFAEMTTIERRQFIADFLGKSPGQVFASEYRRLEAELLRKPERDQQTADRTPARRRRPYEIDQPVVVDGMHTDSPEWRALEPEDRIAKVRRAMGSG